MKRNPKGLESALMNPRPSFVFAVGGCLCAVDLHAVERVLRAAALTRTPEAPELLAGLLHFRGRLIPVYDLKTYLGCEVRPLRPEDRLLLLATGGRRAALVADQVIGVAVLGEDQGLKTAPPLFRLGGVVRGMGKLDGAAVLIFDTAGLWQHFASGTDAPCAG